MWSGGDKKLEPETFEPRTELEVGPEPRLVDTAHNRGVVCHLKLVTTVWRMSYCKTLVVGTEDKDV